MVAVAQRLEQLAPQIDGVVGHAHGHPGHRVQDAEPGSVPTTATGNRNRNASACATQVGIVVAELHAPHPASVAEVAPGHLDAVNFAHVDQGQDAGVLVKDGFGRRRIGRDRAQVGDGLQVSGRARVRVITGGALTCVVLVAVIPSFLRVVTCGDAHCLLLVSVPVHPDAADIWS